MIICETREKRVYGTGSLAQSKTTRCSHSQFWKKKRPDEVRLFAFGTFSRSGHQSFDKDILASNILEILSPPPARSANLFCEGSSGQAVSRLLNIASTTALAISRDVLSQAEIF